ncbi:oligopeptide transporter 4-like [Gossypium australe]|uniref:Oligopeptide transporter 4-like n=1 Tax=Gossypium australe TaxID=47621 RepID=A0A5B6WS39_9ROSI|nr:oligopeptide transporter 4-like [Gossypium australe]
MQDLAPPAVGNMPRANPLFNDADDNALGNLPAPQLPANIQMAQNERTSRDYALPSINMVQETIAMPAITTNNFETKLAMIQMIQNNLQFKGTMIEDPNQHVQWFLQLCDTFKYSGVTDDTIHIRLFPFSLIDNAFSWLDSQTPGSITAWDELVGMFLQKWREKVSMRHRNAFLSGCGLDANARSRLDGATRGALMNRTYEDAYEIIENMELNSYQWPIERLIHGQKLVIVKVI